MIKRIKYIKNFNIYTHLKTDGVSDFAEHNFFLGYNGSGKTTLSRFFQKLSGNNFDKSASFEVVDERGSVTTAQSGQRIRTAVFNSDFVHDNLDFYNNRINIGQENIALMKLISESEENKKKLISKQKDLEKLMETYSVDVISDIKPEQLSELHAELSKYSQFAHTPLAELKGKLNDRNFHNTYIFGKEGQENDEFERLKAKANAGELTKKEINSFIAHLVIEMSKERLMKKIKEERSEVIRGIAIEHKRLDQLKKQLIRFDTKTMTAELQNFLCRDELKFEYNGDRTLCVKRFNEIASGLSDAEKSAVALVYFFNTLAADDNLVVVLDDPITSMDNQNLFSACNYIRLKTRLLKQIFIFSHSFELLSSLINTFEGSKKSRSFYFIESVGEGKARTARIKELPFSCYTSQYQLLFKQVYDFVHNARADELTSSYQMPNLCRQLLEMFLAFKTGESQLRSALTAVKKKYDVEKINLEKIKKFLDSNSHSFNQDAGFVSFLDKRVFETAQIAAAVLELIRVIDGDHYQNMTDILAK